MKKVLTILAREYRIRLRRPSFWVLTVLVPMALALLYALPVFTANHRAERALVLVVDQTGLFANGLQSTLEVGFKPMPSLDFAQRKMQEDKQVSAVLFIPMRETTIPHDAFLYHRGKSPSVELQSMIDGQLQILLRNALLEDVYNLEPSVYHSIETTHIRLRTQDAATGRESFAQVKSAVAVALAVLMVVALLLFGVQVMRSVQEERQNRVAEIIVSSVRPVELMVGKVTGVAFVALTQLALWVLLTAAAIGGIQAANPTLFAQARQQQAMHSLATKGAEATAQYAAPVNLVDEAVQGLTAIDLPLVAGMFLLFFLLGYLLYGAMLAALAACLDSDADALQWALLTGLPLLAVLALLPVLLRAADGTLAVVLGLVPFTAPVAMMARIPFGVPVWQVVVSAVILLVTFAAVAVLASRVYRRNILPRQ